MDLPPPSYDHPFAGKLELHGVAIDEIYPHCKPFTGYACAPIKAVGTCDIYFVIGKLTPDLFRHERAHCNGWPADHPGAL